MASTGSLGTLRTSGSARGGAKLSGHQKLPLRRMVGEVSFVCCRSWSTGLRWWCKTPPALWVARVVAWCRQRQSVNDARILTLWRRLNLDPLAVCLSWLVFGACGRGDAAEVSVLEPVAVS
jgi:hypothetical protein